jgi:hypothetical protein
VVHCRIAKRHLGEIEGDGVDVQPHRRRDVGAFEDVA